MHFRAPPAASRRFKRYDRLYRLRQDALFQLRKIVVEIRIRQFIQIFDRRDDRFGLERASAGSRDDAIDTFAVFVALGDAPNEARKGNIALSRTNIVNE